MHPSATTGIDNDRQCELERLKRKPDGRQLPTQCSSPVDRLAAETLTRHTSPSAHPQHICRHARPQHISSLEAETAYLTSLLEIHVYEVSNPR